MVACNGAVPPRGLNVLQEAQYRIDDKIAKPNLGNSSFPLLGGKKQKELKRVTVSLDRVRAHTPMDSQVIGEKRFD
jgi:hypothetical protein